MAMARSLVAPGIEAAVQLGPQGPGRAPGGEVEGWRGGRAAQDGQDLLQQQARGLPRMWEGPRTQEGPRKRGTAPGAQDGAKAGGFGTSPSPCNLDSARGVSPEHTEKLVVIFISCT